MAARNAIETHIFENHLGIQIEADWPTEQPQERSPAAMRESMQSLLARCRIARHFEQHVHPSAIGLRPHGLDDVHVSRIEDPSRAHALGELTPQWTDLRRQVTGGP